MVFIIAFCNSTALSPNCISNFFLNCATLSFFLLFIPSATFQYTNGKLRTNALDADANEVAGSSFAVTIC